MVNGYNTVLKLGVHLHHDTILGKTSSAQLYSRSYQQHRRFILNWQEIVCGQ